MNLLWNGYPMNTCFFTSNITIILWDFKGKNFKTLGNHLSIACFVYFIPNSLRLGQL